MLDDRPYMRADPYRKTWSATVILMIAVAACFLLQQLLPLGAQIWIEENLGLTADSLKRGHVWQLLTFQFLHGGLLHVAGNLFVLWMFGRIVEARLGMRSFLALYFLSGVAGGLLQAALSWLWPAHFGGITFGASAGTAGLVAAFALIEPDAMIGLFFILPIRARYLLWIELGISLLFTVIPTNTNVAHAAHLGGILAAMGYMRWDRHRPVVAWNPLQGRRRKRQLVQAAAQVTRWRGQRGQELVELPPEEFISREVDPILDKISAHGIHSLTPREKQILEAARAKMGKR